MYSFSPSFFCRFQAFCFPLVFFLLLPSRATSAPLPQDAQALLNRLPNKTISLDVVLGRAIQSSDSYQQVVAQFPAVEVSRLRVDSAFDPVLSVGIGYTLDRNEQLSPFAPSNIRANQYKLGVAKNFSTGSALSLELKTDHQTFSFPGQQLSPYQTRLDLGFRQNLLRDSFGVAARLDLESAKHAREAALASFYSSIEEWSIAIMQLYYDAWLAKMKALATQDNTARRVRLANTVKVKERRGTSETPDVLQVQSALLFAQMQEAEARQLLQDKWQNLVISLKLPKPWLDIDARQIPLSVDDPISKALKLCSQRPQELTDENAPSSVTKSVREARAAETQLKAARNRLRPDLDFVLRASTNGVDFQSRNVTFQDVQDFNNPAYTVGLELSYPIGSSADEAQYREALTSAERAKAAASTAKDNWQLNWLTYCAELSRLNQSLEQSVRAYENQTQRVRLDEKRFEIGRSSILSVVQAGDDATQAELSLRAIEVQTRLSAWRIHRLQDGLKSYLTSLSKVGSYQL